MEKEAKESALKMSEQEEKMRKQQLKIEEMNKKTAATTGGSISLPSN